jgi:formate hydrogenlyase subunit 3/multisubunit Na+/H+ antiporter MnhD subunit
MNAWPVVGDLGLEPMAWLPGLAPLWPLLLAAALVPAALRAPVLRMAPWAALPALLIAVLAPQTLQPLPWLLLGTTLQLDDAGRWLLAALSLLWLAAGWIVAERLRSPRRAAGFLVAMSGGLWLPLTGDLPSALAASTLAAYPLYGLLAGLNGGRVLLVSVVIADLLILEALLLLAKDGAGLDFASLRAALAQTHERNFLLALVLIGFGAKAGAMGLHYWLASAVAGARAWLLAPLVGFVIAAGALFWLRLLPLGDVQWPAVAALMQWLGLAGGGWAVLAGLLQATPRASLAYALSALTMLWLGLLGLSLGRPAEAAAGMSAVFPPALALTGLAMASALLGSLAPARAARAVLVPLSALLISVTALAAALLAGAGTGDARWLVLGAIACVGVLLGASAVSAVRVDGASEANRETLAAAALLAAGCVMAAFASPALSPMLASLDEWRLDSVAALPAALLAGLVGGAIAGPASAWLPRAPAGDLLVALERTVSLLVAAWERFGAALERRRDRLYRSAGQARVVARRNHPASAIEALLRRWSIATLLLLLSAAAAALLLASPS